MTMSVALHAPIPAAAGAAAAATVRPSARAPPAASSASELCGEPVTPVLTVPACKGLAVRVAKGQLLLVTNTSGVQVRLTFVSWPLRGVRRAATVPLGTVNA